MRSRGRPAMFGYAGIVKPEEPDFWSIVVPHTDMVIRRQRRLNKWSSSYAKYTCAGVRGNANGCWSGTNQAVLGRQPAHRRAAQARRIGSGAQEAPTHRGHTVIFVGRKRMCS